MIIQTSLLKELLQAQPQVRTQTYFKPSLIALCHAMEDQVFVGGDRPLVIVSFQRERFFRQQTHRYLQIAERTEQLYILTAPEADFTSGSQPCEIIPFDLEDAMSQEWHMVIIGQQYASCLHFRGQGSPLLEAAPQSEPLDQARRFEGFWSFDRQLSCVAAQLLLKRVLLYRPQLTSKINQAISQLTPESSSGLYQIDPTPFSERLVTYLQTAQYKLLKAYNLIVAQERKDRLLDTINVAVRRSPNLDEILQITVQKLGQTLSSCRCLIYPCKPTDQTVTIQHEFLSADLVSLVGQVWSLADNPLLQKVLQKQESIYIEDSQTELNLTTESLQNLVERASIRDWLIVPVLNQGRILGIIELHNSSEESSSVWDDEVVSLVEIVATLVGVALVQSKD